MQRLLELLLGLDKGFLSREGELTWHFDPHWPGPLIQTGLTGNFLLGLLVLGLLFYLATRKASSDRRYVSGGACLLGAISLAAVPVPGWNYLLVVLWLGLASVLFFRNRPAGLLAFARVSAALFFFSLLSGAVAWNLALAVGAALLVLYVYSREGRSTPVKVSLGVARALVLAFVLMLLNNPILTLGQVLVEPSVMAVMLDDSLSMKIQDVSSAPNAAGPSRLEAVLDVLTGSDQALIRGLARTHTLRFYSFDQNARPMGAVEGLPPDHKKQAQPQVDPALLAALAALKPTGASTQVVPSILTVLDDLQGQRLAGIVVLTDGRDTPSSPLADAFKALKSHGVKVYPVAVGSDKAPTNIELASVNVEDSIFKGDISNVRVSVRGTGYEPNHPVRIVLKDKKTDLPLRGPDGKPAEKLITLPDDKPVEEELLFKPDQVGPLELKIEAEKQPGEIDEKDNIRTAQVAVLDARISVLYVDGYPRWEYRYIKNEMIRDKTVDISCLLTSADPSFAQEGDPPNPETGFPGPIRRFPESLDELLAYDVVLFGDVDPRQFTDRQLQMLSDFVSKKGGGFGMIAGSRWSPAAYRNTAIEGILPVNISHVQADEAPGDITDGFRPVLTREGQSSSVFRFFNDKDRNEKYLKDDLQPLFWYCRGITSKPGVGEVYAEHPSDVGPDGRKAPLLVVGRFGAGRTLFSAFDDSWRWRFYTGESVFDTYWVEQLRYLARSKKLGQRRLPFTSDRPVYTLGDQIRVGLRILDPLLLQQLPPELSVQVDDENGQPLRTEKLLRQEGQSDYYVASFGADRVGHFSAKLPPIAPEAGSAEFEVMTPRLELADPKVDRTLLSRVAAETLGQPVKLEETRAKLPGLIPSAARTIPLLSSQPLWDAPLAMVIFVLLITAEWVMRKVYGML